MNWIIITIGTPPITKLDPGVTLPPFADNGWFFRLNAIYFCCFPASHVWFQKDKSAKSIKTHELHKSTAIPFYKSIKIHYIKIKKKTFKSMKNKKKTWQCVKTLYPFCSHQNSWDLWMFIPLKMVCIGIDPYPHKTHQTHRYLVGPSPGHRHRGALGSKPCTEDTLAVTLSTAKMTSMKASVNTTRKSGVTFCGFFPSKKKPEIFPMVTWPVDFFPSKMSDLFFEKSPSE